MTCRPEDLEALTRDELPSAEAARLLEHVEACASCRQELEWLRTERQLFAQRRRGEAAPPAELWQAVERRIERDAPRISVPRAWLAGAAVALAAAALVVILREPRPVVVRHGPLDAGALARETDADEVVTRAEQQYQGAIALLEAQYLLRRGHLDPGAAEQVDAALARTRSDLEVARQEGDPLEARVRALEGYAIYMRSLQTVVYDLPEGKP